MKKLFIAILSAFKKRKKNDVIINVDIVTVGYRSRREVEQIAEISVDLLYRTLNYKDN